MDRLDFRLPVVIYTSRNGVLRRPIESAQYPSIRYTGRLAEAGIDISVGTVGGSYDSALAESIIGLFKTEVIRFLGPWRSVAQVKWETLKWVDWYNNPRLHSTIGYVTPKEAEEIAYASVNAAEKAASSMKQKLAGKTRGSSVCFSEFALACTADRYFGVCHGRPGVGKTRSRRLNICAIFMTAAGSRSS